MQNENELPADYDDALTTLIALGLLDVFQTDDGQGYRLSEAISTDDFVPNAALFAILDFASEPETLLKKT